MDILTLIAETIEVDPTELRPEHSVGEIGNWDSVHNLLIFAKIEAKYGIALPPESLYTLTTVQSIIDAVDAAQSHLL